MCKHLTTSQGFLTLPLVQKLPTENGLPKKLKQFSSYFSFLAYSNTSGLLDKSDTFQVFMELE